MNEPKKRGSKTTLWKPGQSGNPSGRPKMDPIIKAFKEKSEKEFIQALSMYGEYTIDEMEEYLASNIGVMEKLFAKFIWDAANGDSSARALVIERLFGKMKETVDLNVKVKQLPDSELLALTKEAIQVLEVEAKETPSELDSDLNTITVSPTKDSGTS